MTGNVDQDIGGFGQGEYFQQTSGSAIQEQDLEDFGQGLFDLGSGQGTNKENQPPPSAAPGPRRRDPRDEDEADCRPLSQKDTFLRVQRLKILQRRERQTPSPKQQGFHQPAPAFVSPFESNMPVTRKKALEGNENDNESTNPTSEDDDTSQPSLQDTSSEETPSETTLQESTNNDEEPSSERPNGPSERPSGQSERPSGQLQRTSGPSQLPQAKRLKLPDELPDSLRAYETKMAEGRADMLKKMKKCNAQERLKYIGTLSKENVVMRVEVAFLNLEIEKVSNDGDKDRIMALTEENGKKDKKIGALEKQVRELEALQRATKGVINKEVSEEVTNWAKEDGWRSQKFLTSDAEVRKFAKECTKKLTAVNEYHGDEDKEAVFYLTYGKALSKGISSKRNYLTQELKKLFFDLMKAGKTPYTHEDLLRCAKRNIDFEVRLHMFCAIGHTFCC